MAFLGEKKCYWVLLEKKINTVHLVGGGVERCYLSSSEVYFLTSKESKQDLSGVLNFLGVL